MRNTRPAIGRTRSALRSTWASRSVRRHAGERLPVLLRGRHRRFSDMRLIGELYRPQVAFLPIGGHYTMDPRTAAVAVELLGSPDVIPMITARTRSCRARLSSSDRACRSRRVGRGARSSAGRPGAAGRRNPRAAVRGSGTSTEPSDVRPVKPKDVNASGPIAGHDTRAVRGHRGREHPAIAAERREGPAAVDVPHANGAVPRSRRHKRAIRVDVDRRHRVAVVRQGRT